MKINWLVRFKNPVFVFQLVLSVLTPILTYFGLTEADLTTWQGLGEVLLKAVSNPYVVGLIIISVWNALNDPTTSGLSDSEQARQYTEPK